MARVTRRVATITLVVNARSDENTFKETGYIGGQTSLELEASLTAWVGRWFANQFPRPHEKSSLELASAAVTIS